MRRSRVQFILQKSKVSAIISRIALKFMRLKINHIEDFISVISVVKLTHLHPSF